MMLRKSAKISIFPRYVKVEGRVWVVVNGGNRGRRAYDSASEHPYHAPDTVNFDLIQRGSLGHQSRKHIRVVVPGSGSMMSHRGR